MNTKGIKRIHLSLVLALIGIFTVACGTDSADSTSTTDTSSVTTGLVVTTTTSATSSNAQYTPKNIVAIWVETSAGTFVKSLTVYAGVRKSDLSSWNKSSAGSTTDAVTSATRSSYGTINSVWNGKDAKGTEVADGSYKLCMELTDKSSTGNYASFAFTKGATESTLTPANVPSFSSTTIKWMPLK